MTEEVADAWDEGAHSMTAGHRRFLTISPSIAGVLMGTLARAREAGDGETHLTMLATPDRFLVTVGIFAAFGGAARLLFHWDRGRSWQRHVGQVLVSIFVGLLSALVAWDILRERPTILLALGGAAGWLGGDIVAQVARFVLRRNLPEDL